jgi:DNA-binding transcriptional ArsR family regulator
MPATVNPSVDLLTKAKLFRGFADPSRLGILESLRGAVRSVTEIVEITGLTQPNTSNHLACLFQCGLVERERRGKFVFYRLADERVEDPRSRARRPKWPRVKPVPASTVGRTAGTRTPSDTR